MMKAFVDKETCVGCGLCAGTAPDVFRMNDEDKAEAYAATVSVTAGGTLTGGTELDLVRVKVADNSNFINSVKGSDDLPRGISPGTYYYRFTNLGTDVVTGVFRLSWEDRPIGG